MRMFGKDHVAFQKSIVQQLAEIQCSMIYNHFVTLSIFLFIEAPSLTLYFEYTLCKQRGSYKGKEFIIFCISR